MLVTILLGIIAFLYLAGLALASEYVEVMEESDLKYGIPKMPALPRAIFLLSWPYHVTTAMFSGPRNEE